MWTAAGIKWIAGALTATHVLVVCLHLPLISIPKVTLAAPWKGRPQGQSLQLTVVSLLMEQTGSRTGVGLLGYSISNKFSGLFCSCPMKNISVWVRGEGLERDRAQVPGQPPETSLKLDVAGVGLLQMLPIGTCVPFLRVFRET